MPMYSTYNLFRWDGLCTYTCTIQYMKKHYYLKVEEYLLPESQLLN